MPRIAFTSVGCKLNRYEIQVMAESLRPYGFRTVPFSHEADCYVINTCSVTSDADQSSRQLIRRAKRRNLEAKVIATGCYAQLQPREINEIGVDAVIPNRDKEKLPEMVLNLFNISKDANNPSGPSLISGMEGMTRAFVKIQDGCDNECAFCAIWMARGPVYSRPLNQIIQEINKLTTNGFKEVVLTGIHIGKYLHEDHNLIKLFEKLLENTSIERIRLSSLNPTEVTGELISILKLNQRLCPHVHVSLQSGDDNVLASMGRKYSRNDIISVTDNLMEAIPNITIGADFIVGFPGETIAAFENTRRLIEEGNLHHLHIFPYSDRPGTKASKMDHKVSAGEKTRRTAILRDLGRDKRSRHLESFLGKKLRVLFEKREYQLRMTGLSENYIRVDAPLERKYLGQIVDVIPTELAGDNLITNVNIRP